MYKKWRDLKKKSDGRDRTCWVWCPICKRDLNGDSKSFVSDEEVVTYQCATCASISTWDFDTPAPVCLTVAEQLAIL